MAPALPVPVLLSRLQAVKATLESLDRATADELLSPADAGAALPRIACPALVIMGDEDPDWADPRAEAEGIVAEMPAGLGAVAMIKGAGHYPHAQCAGEVAALVATFVREH